MICPNLILTSVTPAYNSKHLLHAAHVTHFTMNLSSLSLFVRSLFNTALPLDYTPSIVMHNDAHGACHPTPFPAFPLLRTLCSTVAHPTRLHTHESFLDGLYISYPLSHRHLLSRLRPPFAPLFTCLLTLSSPLHNLALATNITASVDICSGALLFLFVCMPQLSIPGRPVHSAITLNKGKC